MRTFLVQWVTMSLAIAGFLAVYSRVRFGVWFNATATFYVLTAPLIAGGGALGAAYRRRERRSNRH